MNNHVQSWSLKRLRFVTTSPSKKEVRCLDENTEVSFVPMEAIGEEGQLETAGVKTIGEVQNGYTYFRDGDVVIAKITPCFENGKGAIARGLINSIGFGTTELHVIRPSKDLDARFLFYITKSEQFRKLGEGEMYGAGGQKRVPESFIQNFRQLMPPVTEQCVIADFLDRETARIGSFINLQERLKSAVLAQEHSAIAFALCEGLVQNVRLKPSGLRWVKAVPDHWAIRRLKYVSRRESGHTPSRTVSEYWENCDIPWISLNEVGYLAENDYIGETKNYINALGLANSSARMLPKDTVILSRDATVGRCGILSCPMATSQHFVNYICGPKLLPEYLLFIFRYPMQDEFACLSMGSTLRTIGIPDVNSFAVPIPPVEEQKLIVAHVKEMRDALRAGRQLVEGSIIKLREFRLALVSAAVTGQINIRNYRPQEASSICQ
jgi:type I restriction enzyme S subunit